MNTCCEKCENFVALDGSCDNCPCHQEKPNQEIGSVRWAQEKRETCKLCLRLPAYNFCKRHAPRTTITRSVWYTQEQLDRALTHQKESIVSKLERMKEKMPDFSDPFYETNNEMQRQMVVQMRTGITVKNQILADAVEVVKEA